MIFGRIYIAINIYLLFILQYIYYYYIYVSYFRSTKEDTFLFNLCVYCFCVFIYIKNRICIYI